LELRPGDSLQRGISPQALGACGLQLGEGAAGRARDGLQLRATFEPLGDDTA
jgi:hypothetical protein